jgi:uracil phosphoribosyltransferase
MSPRWTLSTTPFLICRTRIGETAVRRAGVAGRDGLRRDADRPVVERMIAKRDGLRSRRWEAEDSAPPLDARTVGRGNVRTTVGGHPFGRPIATFDRPSKRTVGPRRVDVNRSPDLHSSAISVPTCPVPNGARCYDAGDLPKTPEDPVSDTSATAPTPTPGVPSWPSLHVSTHPAVLHKLAILRDVGTEPKKFREIVRELSWLLGHEALADVRVRAIEIDTPLETMQAYELADRIGLVPILRAGLGMVDAMLELMPTAEVWHLGLFRDERTLRPVEYYNKLPDSTTVDLCLILDPMLATGGSATAAIEVLKRWGATRIKLINLIAAPEGVAAVTAAHPDVEIYCAALDRQLNEKGYIMPGLGDAGDRQFGTGH